MYLPSSPQRGSRNNWRLGGIASVTVAALMLTLSGCGSDGGAGTDAPGNDPVSEGEFPSYYPADYGDIVEESKAEGSDFIIYANTNQAVWEPVFRDFQKKYPWVTKISANNIEDEEVFQRQLSEMATNTPTADLLIGSAAQAWVEYAGRDNSLMEYESPELSKLPDYAELLPNVYAISLDPIGMIYNSAVVDKPMTGINDLVDYVTADPGKYKNMVSTRDIGGLWGFQVMRAWTEGNPDAWNLAEKILPLARPETSSGSQKDKVLSGEYASAFLVSASVGYPAEKESSGLLTFVLPKDGTVVLSRGMGITPKAPHAATAKLFVDFIMSEEGQNSVAEGGLTSYRDSVKPGEGQHTYQQLVEQVGEDHVIRVPYEALSDTEIDAFTTRWDGLLGK